MEKAIACGGPRIVWQDFCHQYRIYRRVAGGFERGLEATPELSGLPRGIDGKKFHEDPDDIWHTPRSH